MRRGEGAAGRASAAMLAWQAESGWRRSVVALWDLSWVGADRGRRCEQ